MSNLLYRDHTIVSSAVHDDAGGNWKITAYVSWAEDGSPSRRLHFIRNNAERFSRFEDAEMAGMERAKNWVDSHLHLRELG
jgi:hypothetical protein